jgi:hypothetical protein
MSNDLIYKFSEQMKKSGLDQDSLFQSSIKKEKTSNSSSSSTKSNSLKRVYNPKLSCSFNGLKSKESEILNSIGC